MDTVLFIIYFLVGLFFYLIPVIVASNRNHKHADAILALNLMTGWTVIGWVASLVWALTAPSATARTRSQ